MLEGNRRRLKIYVGRNFLVWILCPSIMLRFWKAPVQHRIIDDNVIEVPWSLRHPYSSLLYLHTVVISSVHYRRSSIWDTPAFNLDIVVPAGKFKAVQVSWESWDIEDLESWTPNQLILAPWLHCTYTIIWQVPDSDSMVTFRNISMPSNKKRTNSSTGIGSVWILIHSCNLLGFWGVMLSQMVSETLTFRKQNFAAWKNSTAVSSIWWPSRLVLCSCVRVTR